MIWLSDTAGQLIPSSEQKRFSCRGFIPPVGQGLNDYDHSILALKGCSGQVTVQLQGTPGSIMHIQTTLIHHQQLVQERASHDEGRAWPIGTHARTKQGSAGAAVLERKLI